MNNEPLIRVPDREYGPAPWYAWIGELSPARLDRDLQRFLALEIYEIIIISLYGLEPEYLGEEYLELYRHTCQRCREWGMKLWIYDEFNWPSGTCAGRVLRDSPEARQRMIRFSWPDSDMRGEPSWEIVEHEGFDLAAHGAAWALNSNGYVDALSESAIARFIELTHEVYKAAVGEFFGDVIVGFFTDEPVVVKGSGLVFPYTPGLFELFAQRFGFRLEDRLAALVRDGRDSLRVRQCYWELVADLFKRHCMRQLAQWCGSHDLSLTGHLLFEEILAGNTRKNGDVYDALDELQTPGIDLLEGVTSFDRNPGCAYARAFGDARSVDVTGKIIESVTFFAGKRRNLCESFGCTPNSGTAQLYKRAADFLLHHGISLINDNLFASSNSSFRKFCGCHAFRTPWVTHYGRFSRHVATLSFLNSESRLVTNVGVYYPGTDARARFGAPGTVFGVAGHAAPANQEWVRTQQTIFAVAHGLIANQWDYYFLFDQVLVEGEVEGGAFRRSGFECRVIVFPEIHYLSTDVARALSRFVAAGGAAVCVGRIPQAVDSQGEVTDLEPAPADGVILVQADLDAIGARLADVLSRRLKREVEISGAGLQDVMLTHRASKGAEHVFITNFGETPVRFGHNLDKRWCAADTVTREATACVGGEPIALAPNESILLVRTDAAGAGVSSAAARAGKPGTKIEFDSTWRLGRPVANTYSLPMQVYAGDGDCPRDSLRLDDDSWGPPVREIAPAALTPGEVHWLRGRFLLELSPGQLSFTVDGCDSCELFVNGSSATRRIEKVVWDDDNVTYEIADLARPGENEILVRYVPAPIREHVLKIPMFRAGPGNDLPPFVVAGDFAVREQAERPPALGPTPSSLRTGSIYAQGFPTFVGVLELEQEFRVPAPGPNAVLDLGRQSDAFEVLLNGRAAGVLCWPPYGLAVGPLLNAGENRLTLRLLTARGRLLKRHYVNVEDTPPPAGLLDEPALWV